MRRRFLLLLAFTAAGCSTDRPIDCAHAVEPERLARCYDRHSRAGEEAGLLACLPFSGPTRMRGQWYFDLEYSGFTETAKQDPSETWLYIGSAFRRKVEFATPPGRPVEIDFIGRRSLCEGAGYGHMGMSKRAIIVEKVISFRR